jgi:hypothetical protein
MANQLLSRHYTRFSLPLICLVPLFLSGCGGRGGITVPRPISVYLPISTVHVTAGAKSVTIPVQIGSTSETALVSAVGFPAGVQMTYASSDTNPSGSLTFSASSTAVTGSYMPTVFVMSAGSTASTGFTLEVAAP